MPKITALKILDKAILPVALVVGIKLLSIFVLTLFFGISWSFDSEIKNRLLFFSFGDFGELVFVSTFSDILVVLVSCLGLAWSIFRSSTFRRDKIHPAMEVNLRQKSREALLLSKEEGRNQTSIWLTISWLLMFVVLNNVLVGISSFFVLGLGLGVNLTLTLVFYQELIKN